MIGKRHGVLKRSLYKFSLKRYVQEKAKFCQVREDICVLKMKVKN